MAEKSLWIPERDKKQPRQLGECRKVGFRSCEVHEALRPATKEEYLKVAAKENQPRRHSNAGRTQDVGHYDRGTEIAHKTMVYTRGKVSDTKYSINPEYLDEAEPDAQTSPRKLQEDAENMPPDVRRAYEAWIKAANRGYNSGRGGRGSLTHPSDMAKVDARIRALKQRYEDLLGKWKRRRVVPDDPDKWTPGPTTT